MPRPFKFPHTVRGAVDLLYTTRQTRLRTQTTVETLKEHEEKLREFIAANCTVGEVVTGNDGRAEIVERYEYVVEDWAELYDFILRYQTWEILKKAVVDSALEKWFNERGLPVPGVTRRIVKQVSIQVR